MLEQVDVIDSIEVVSLGIIQVRKATRIMNDGVQIGSDSLSRWCLLPGQDVSDQTAQVQAVCTAVWTEEVVAAYLASIQPPA